MSIPYWRLSALYLFYFASVGAFVPYWSLYLKHSGFNPAEIGQLSAMMLSTKIIAPNVWGWIADFTGKSVRMIRLASLLTAILFAGFLWVQQYVGFAVLIVSFSFFWNAVLPQFEAITLYHLKDQAYRYSQIRLWGSVGFIVTVLVLGWMFEHRSIQDLVYYLLALLVLSALTTLTTPEVKLNNTESISLKLLPILKTPAVLVFLIVNILVQISHTPYYVFFSLYLKHHQYGSTLIGSLWALGVVAEIVLFIVMKPLLNRFSLRAILLVSLFLASVRWLLIAWFPEHLWVLIAAQLCHAATFGGTHVVAIHFVHQYFGEQHQGKGQAIYNSLSFGIGGVLGSFFSGHYWELLGGNFIFSIAAACCGLAFLIAYYGIGPKNKQVKQVLG